MVYYCSALYRLLAIADELSEPLALETDPVACKEIVNTNRRSSRRIRHTPVVQSDSFSKHVETTRAVIVRCPNSAHFGASAARELASWNPLPGSADADLDFDLPTLRSRSRDLVRNHGIASGGVQSIALMAED